MMVMKIWNIPPPAGAMRRKNMHVAPGRIDSVPEGIFFLLPSD
jgi:hypothetical protein